MGKDEGGRVFLNGYIDVPEDRLEAVRTALPEHIALTRQEDGCLSFEVAPDDTVPGRFMVSESFASQAAFDAHQTRTRNSKWFEITQGIPREYTITSEKPEQE